MSEAGGFFSAGETRTDENITKGSSSPRHTHVRRPREKEVGRQGMLLRINTAK